MIGEPDLPPRITKKFIPSNNKAIGIFNQIDSLPKDNVLTTKYRCNTNPSVISIISINTDSKIGEDALDAIASLGVVIQLQALWHLF